MNLNRENTTLEKGKILRVKIGRNNKTGRQLFSYFYSNILNTQSSHANFKTRIKYVKIQIHKNKNMFLCLVVFFKQK